VGAMGAVFAATHRNGMRVAIKILHEELSKHADLRTRFLREGYIANRVKHPSLVRVLDDDVDDDGTTFLVMELLEGTTLEAEWEAAGHTMPLGRVIAIADAVLDVLGAIHAQGIVHRDVKPENVFFTADGMKLLDLGIARLGESTTTASGQIMGTPEFVAPEQAGGLVREIDARTDLYSVGAMMLTLLTGSSVHEASTPMERMIFAATKQARSLRDIWPEAPPALVNVIDVALAFDKNRRWASAGEMRTALHNAASLAGDAPTRAAASPVTTGPTGTVVVGRMEAGGDVMATAAVPLVRPARKRKG
jgi:serine/threonine protein kinase